MAEHNGRTETPKGVAVPRPRPTTRSDEQRFPTQKPGEGWGRALPWLQLVSSALSLASTFVMLAVALPMLSREQEKVEQLATYLDAAAEKMLTRDKLLVESRDQAVRTQAALLLHQENARKVTEENIRLANLLSEKLKRMDEE